MLRTVLLHNGLLHESPLREPITVIIEIVPRRAMSGCQGFNREPISYYRNYRTLVFEVSVELPNTESILSGCRA